MRSIHVGVRHDDDLVVTKLCRIEIILANSRSQGGDHRCNFRVREHLVVAGLLDIQDLSLDGQNRLGSPVAALLGGTAGRIAFHNEDF